MGGKLPLIFKNHYSGGGNGWWQAQITDKKSIKSWQMFYSYSMSLLTGQLSKVWA